MVLTLALKMLTPILVGFITPFALDAIKRGNALLDDAPAYVKQGAAVGIAGAATMLSNLLEVGALPTDLAQWDQTVVKTLVAGFLAIAIKQHKQLKKAQDAAHH
jgi:hypothetical protein